MVNLTRQHALQSYHFSRHDISDHPSPPFLDSTSTRYRALQRNCSLAPKESITNPKMRPAAPQIQLQPFTAADAHDAAVVFSLAFAEDPVEKLICSEVTAEQKRAIRIEEYQRGLELPGAHVVKAVDVAAGGKLVGAVGFLGAGGFQWTLPVREGAAEFERRVHEIAAEHREKVLQGKWDDVWEVYQLFVHPDYQRRGIGKEMLQWGLAKSDKAGCKVYVESSRKGKGAYEALGFEVKESLNIEVDGKDETTYILVRPVGGLKQ